MPAYEPTEPDRRIVESMASYGIDHHEICKVILNPRTGKPIAPKTLRRAFREELDTGMTKANAKVAESLFVQAVGAPAVLNGDGKVLREEQKRVPACGIFWAKTRMGWREPQVIQHSGAIGSYDLSKLSDEQIKQIETILSQAAIAPGDQTRTSET